MSSAIEPVLKFAHAGDLLVLDGETWMLFSNCGASAQMMACLTCSQRLANQGQLEMHIATGEHRIAAWCPEHGTWEAMA